MSNIRRRTYSNSGVYFDPRYFVVLSELDNKINIIDIRTLSVVISVDSMYDSEVYYSESHQARIDFEDQDKLILGGRGIIIRSLDKSAIIDIGTNVSNLPIRNTSIHDNYKVVNTDFKNFGYCSAQVVNLSSLSTYGTDGVIHDGFGGMYIFTYNYEKLAKIDSNFNVVSLTNASSDLSKLMSDAYYTFYDKGVILVTKIESKTTYYYRTNRYLVNLDNMTIATIATNISEDTYSGIPESTLVV